GSSRNNVGARRGDGEVRGGDPVESSGDGERVVAELRLQVVAGRRDAEGLRVLQSVARDDNEAARVDGGGSAVRHVLPDTIGARGEGESSGADGRGIHLGRVVPEGEGARATDKKGDSGGTGNGTLNKLV